MRKLGKYIIRKKDSPFWYIQLPGHPARSTKIHVDCADGKQARENEKCVQRIRDGALRGEAWALEALGHDTSRAAKHSATGPTLGEWIEAWQTTYQVKHAEITIKNEGPKVRYWQALWGSRVLRAITREHGDQWQTGFQRGDTELLQSVVSGRVISNSDSNNNSYLAVLRMILSDALGKRAIRDSETGRYRLPKGSEEGTCYWLPAPGDETVAADTHCLMSIETLTVPETSKGKHYTREQLDAVLAAASGEFRALLRFGTKTGQRLNDLINVTRGDVMPTIDGRYRVVFRQTKNGKAHEMTIARTLFDEMDALPINPACPEYFFGEFKGMGRDGARTAERRRMIAATDKAGIPYICFHHATRATAAMRLHEAGKTTHQIMQALNWESERMVRRYISSMPVGLMNSVCDILDGETPEPTPSSAVEFGKILQMPKQA